MNQGARLTRPRYNWNQARFWRSEKRQRWWAKCHTWWIVQDPQIQNWSYWG